jgi:SulP family sulfate permease
LDGTLSDVRGPIPADLRALAIALVGLGVGIGVRAFRPAWPNYLIGLIAATLASLAFGGASAGIATVGALDSVLPTFRLPGLGFGHVRELTSSAVALAIVGLLSATSVARPLARRSGQIIDSNREFVGQGAANLVGSFFQCYPSSSSFTRSGANLESGAKTPISAIFAGIFLFLILLLVSPLFAAVPVAGMAGVIILVAWRLIEWAEIRHILETSRGETTIAGVTLASTLFVSLEFAIYAGLFMSLVLFLMRIASDRGRQRAGPFDAEPAVPQRTAVPSRGVPAVDHPSPRRPALLGYGRLTPSRVPTLPKRATVAEAYPFHPPASARSTCPRRNS